MPTTPPRRNTPPLRCAICQRPLRPPVGAICWQCEYRSASGPCRCRHDPQYECSCRFSCPRHVICPAAPLLQPEDFFA